MPLKTDRSVEILFLNVHGAPVQKSLMYCKLLTSHVESRVGAAGNHLRRYGMNYYPTTKI